MPCLGNGKDHCCYVNGNPCLYLEENTMPDRRWVCGLVRQLGCWDLVLESASYQDNVAPHFGDMNCRDWPDGEGRNKGYCVDCGVNCGD